MSDYFGALLRSTGAMPATVSARTAPAEGDLIEQHVEVETAAARAAATASPRPEAPAVIEPALDSPANADLQSPVESTPQASPSHQTREVERREPAPSPITRPAIDDEVHSVVRAALQWVRGNPEAVERTLADVAEAPEETGALLRQPGPQKSTPSIRTRAPQTARSELRIEHGDERRQERPAPEQRRAAPAYELDVQLPRVRGASPGFVATTDTAAAAPQGGVEVSIGTIHVSVDAAPATRMVAPPPPSPSRPQATRPAERSGFARSRLPRL